MVKDTVDYPDNITTAAGRAIYTAAIHAATGDLDTYPDQVDTELERQAYTALVAAGFTGGDGVAPTINAKIERDITVTGVTVGNLSNGSVIRRGSTVTEALEQMLMKQIAATYTQPTITLAASRTSFEVGEIANITFTPTWRQNDAGALSKYTLTFDGQQVLNTASAKAYTASSVNMTANKTATATATYAEGVIKNDNMGNPSPNGHITAGSKTASVTLTTYRRLFAGSTTTGKTALTASDDIRALAQSVNDPAKGTSFNLATPAGTTMACFAYPASIGEVAAIAYVENSNMDVRGSFVKSTVQVAGANNAAPIAYNLYTYIPAIPTVGTMTYKVTI